MNFGLILRESEHGKWIYLHGVSLELFGDEELSFGI